MSFSSISNNKKFYGGLCSFFGVMIYANDTLLIALSGVSGFIAGFWRGMFAFLVLCVVFPVVYHGKVFETIKQGGFPMVLSGIMYGIGGVLYALSVANAGTSVSLILLSMAPILTSIFSIIVLHEKPSNKTLCVMAVCFCSVIYMFWGGIEGGGSAFGFLLSFLVPVALGINFTNLRKHPEIPRLGVSLIGGLTSALIGAVMTRGAVLIPFSQIKFLLLLGGFVIPVGQVMIMTGTKYISAPEVSLINSLECVFGLLYVWLVMGIRPTDNNLIGGVVVIAAIMFNVVSDVFLSKKH